MEMILNLKIIKFVPTKVKYLRYLNAKSAFSELPPSLQKLHSIIIHIHTRSIYFIQVTKEINKQTNINYIETTSINYMY